MSCTQLDPTKEADRSRCVPAKREREVWIDVAKGLGIIAVVIGHYSWPGARYLYWFHMPLFFALSGYFFKPILNWQALCKWMRKRFDRLLVPYLAFLIVLFVAEYLRHPIADKQRLISDIAGIAAGGRMITSDFLGVYAPFWFVTCLFATQTVFALIAYRFRTRKSLITLVAAAYLLAHLEAVINRRYSIRVPLNIDVALIALSYYAFGYLAKPVLAWSRRHWSVPTIALILSAGFYAADALNIVHFDLDLKYLGYTNMLLDILVPLTLIVAICWIGHAITATSAGPFFAFLGSASLPIMYMHMYVADICSPRGLISFTLLGISVPLAIWWLVLRRFSLTRRVFLGSS